ncbi:unnamed protein product [Aureobasidium pullulans]|nr:hypothetical protein D6D29_03722 [Aureobasidium pullulans]THV94423.1 hypothetical protein D6D27_03812 [Aureobasidium pullulans]CAD0016807.1 unnamed protein product [Aureobasidium pullulans]CAD0057028.1 unnamed protein product [Aureobasidium pullulans]
MRVASGLAVALFTSLAVAEDQPAGVLNALEAVVTAETSQVQNGIQSLLSQADSLIKNIYPSTTVTDLATLTWPTTVTIGSQTYTVSAGSTLSTSASMSPSSAIASTTENARPILTSTASSIAPSTTSTSSSHNPQMRDPWDRRLGIILGVVLGSIALALGVFLIWFLHRRRKNTGSLFKRRPSSPSDTEVYSWRNDAQAEKYGTSEAPPLLQTPMAAHGGYATRTWTNDDDDMHLGYGYRPEMHLDPAELSAERSERGSLQRTTTSEDRHIGDMQDRPPTPFSPASFAAMAASPVSPIEQDPQRRRSSGFWPPRGSSEGYRNIEPSQVARQPSLAALAGSVAQDYPHPYYQNPFASSEDYDEDDCENPYQDHQRRNLSPTPDIPSRSPKRQSSPMVFYPSSDELGRFNFGTEQGRERRSSELP